MQAPTHVIAGALIEKSFSGLKSKPLRIFLIAVTGLFLHSVFDRIARLTYHPPDPDFSSMFWVSYHIIVLAGFIVSLYCFWKPYKVGIIFSILPDFDWVVKHACNALGISAGFYKEGMIHSCIYWFVDRIPPFSFLQLLPDRTHLKDGILIEIVLIAVMLGVMYFSERKLESQ